MSAFVAGLRRLSEHCKSEATLDDMLRDRLVCGVQDKRLQQRLLAEANLTFKIAMEVSQAVEAAERNARDLQAKQTPKTETVLALNKPRAANLPVSTTKYYRCGGTHLPKDCYFKDAECHFCKKRGHIAKVCHPKTKAEGYRHQHKTHQLTTEDEETDPETEIYSLYKMANNKVSEPIMVTVIANQAALTMEVDTGASASVISKATYQKLWPETPPVLYPSAIKLRTYTGEALKILGSTTVAAKYQGQTAKLPLLIIKGAGPSLLGKDWFSSIRLPWQHLLHKIQTDSTDLQHLLKKHASVFKAEFVQRKDLQRKFMWKKRPNHYFVRLDQFPMP